MSSFLHLPHSFNDPLVWILVSVLFVFFLFIKKGLHIRFLSYIDSYSSKIRDDIQDLEKSYSNLNEDCSLMKKRMDNLSNVLEQKNREKEEKMSLIELAIKKEKTEALDVLHNNHERSYQFNQSIFDQKMKKMLIKAAVKKSSRDIVRHFSIPENCHNYFEYSLKKLDDITRSKEFLPTKNKTS